MGVATPPPFKFQKKGGGDEMKQGKNEKKI